MQDLSNLAFVFIFHTLKFYEKLLVIVIYV